MGTLQARASSSASLHEAAQSMYRLGALLEVLPAPADSAKSARTAAIPANRLIAS